MEYIKGQTLSNLINATKLSIDQIVNYSIQICKGISAAHREGIIHRDIKSENIMITNEDQVKIMDFGLAMSKNKLSVISSESIAGTYSYMSPEQARGENVDIRTDIFSAGVVLYEMITNKLPFKGEIVAAITYSIINENPDPLRVCRPDIPDGLQKIIDKTLQKKPSNRYQKIDEMIVYLNNLRDSFDNIGLESKPITGKIKPSIAVLPFRDMSPKKNQQYFGEGMAEDIINNLTKIRGLHVVARTSSFSLGDSKDDIKEIARKLDVESILEGSVRYIDDRMRITAQLIDVQSGYHIWSERYDRVMKDMFEIQDEISLSIVEKLDVNIEGEFSEMNANRHTENLDAYCLYLKGRYFWNMRTGESLKKAIQYFERAINLDNEYALAYTGLSDSYRALPDYADYRPRDAFEKAKNMAIKAIELDSSLAEAHTSLAVVLNYILDWRGAENEFQKAIELNPDYAAARHWFALFYMYKTKFDKSIAEIRKAYTLDPLSLAINRDVGTILYYS
jgi:TolB-like protein